MISLSCVDSILLELRSLLNYSRITYDKKARYFELIFKDLSHLKVYLICLAEWNDSSFARDMNFGIVEESYILQATLEEAAAFLETRRRGEEATFLAEFDAVVPGLREKIHQCKPKIKEDCLNFLEFPFQCKFSSDELPEFINHISSSLRYHLKADRPLDRRTAKIESLKDNLDFSQEVFEFAARRCTSQEDSKDFQIHIQAWACKAACLSLLHWVLDVDKETMAPRMDVILFDLQKEISPSTPEVTRMYLAVLKASKPSEEDSVTVGNLVMKFVKFLKDNLQVDPDKEEVQMLFTDLICLTTFFMERPEAEKFATEEILTQAVAAVNEVESLISLLCSGDIEEGISVERNFLLRNFLEKATAIKAEVRKIYAHLFLDPSSFSFPKINVLEFIDSLLENLKEFSFCFPKHQIIMLQRELLSLKESNLRDFSTLELQNKHKDIEDLWTRIVNVQYNAERAICSFIYIKKSLWHDILCLSDVIGEIKLIKGQMKMIQDQHMDEIRALNSKMISVPLLPLQANISKLDKVVVGLGAKVKEIRDKLIGGQAKLDIISIVGMPGLGKTTLAKKVYSDASVKLCFHKCAWSTVSQTFNRKKTLLDISSDVAACGGDLSNKEEEDLAEIVRKSLKGQRYLIVLDDIWDINAWIELKMSFPEDNKGSRILFTSRILKVISEANPFPLNPLSKEDSWELLEKKLFDQGCCPPDFDKIGRRIATNCKGLPLAIVLIAGVLKEQVESLNWWIQVGERLDSLIAEKGCTDILALSYKPLPEYLKPWFLYFGSFPEDEEIRVNKLIQLWISEGFIEKHEIKSLEVVAKEYLMDLVARSLVTITKKSSRGVIKACSIHDLLHDFCLAKGEEEKLFKVIEGNEVSYMGTTSAD